MKGIGMLLSSILYSCGMIESENRYINFPITLLNGFSNSVKMRCNQILDFSCFEFSRRDVRNSKKVKDKIKDAGEYFGINYSAESYSKGEIIDIDYNSAKGRNNIKPPKAGVNKNLIFEFRDNEKSVFEIETFIGFCAIRSILQKQSYVKVTKKYVVARMAGFSKSSEFTKAPKNIIKYINRYHFNKIIKELTQNWGLKAFGVHTNGLYLSFTMSREDLGFVVEMNKKKNKEILWKNKNNEENERIKQRVDAKLREKRTTP